MHIRQIGNASALIISLVFGSIAANAATATATFQVSATVLSVCSITAQALSFGNYSAATLDASTTLTVTCSLAAPFSVGLDSGTGAGASIATRRMTSGSSTLAYSLTADPARLVNIGRTLGTDVLSGVGTGTSQALTIYGRVAPNQLVTPGTYTDTITATITY